MTKVIQWILSLFKKKPAPVVIPPVPALALTHPQEPINPSQTLDNVNVVEVIGEWLAQWAVPLDQWDFWKTRIVVEVTTAIQAPAQTYTDQDGIRHLQVRPEWLNPGVVAHEQAHNSYALLTDEQKAQFSALYGPLKATSPLIVYLYSVNQYGLSSDIEGHAEVYRYLGDKMPEILKQFYPRLF